MPKDLISVDHISVLNCDKKILNFVTLFQVAAAAMASSMAMATGAMPDYEHMDERKFRQQLAARNKKAAKNEKRSGELK